MTPAPAHPSSTPAPPAGRPQRRTDVRLQELDGEALVFDMTTADTHHLNTTALFVWQRCDGGHDRRQLTNALCQLYDIAFEEAWPHVERILTELAERRLINDAAAAPAEMEA